ncbi:hypothetical protein GCM10027089_12340 [Nocardia thraciensis]
MNIAALVQHWIVRLVSGGTWPGVRRSTKVAAIRLSMPVSGIRYAHQGTPEAFAASEAVTRATPQTPNPSPAHCRPVTATPSSGPTRAAAASGWSPSINAVVPVFTPRAIAQYTVVRYPVCDSTPMTMCRSMIRGLGRGMARTR